MRAPFGAADPDQPRARAAEAGLHHTGGPLTQSYLQPTQQFTQQVLPSFWGFAGSLISLYDAHKVGGAGPCIAAQPVQSARFPATLCHIRSSQRKYPCQHWRVTGCWSCLCQTSDSMCRCGSHWFLVHLNR